MKRLSRAASRGAKHIVGRARWKVGRRASRRRLERLEQGAKLHLGCGEKHFAGWINVDVDRAVAPDLILDLRFGLPAPPGSVSFIYAEHVLEHLPFESGRILLRDCRTALERGGVLRIAMPDLEHLVRHYLAEWREQPWLSDPAYDWIDSPARMLNQAFYGWGHRYLYDRAELMLRLRKAGFHEISPRGWSESPFPELQGIETRDESLLIVEAVGT